ncbi:MAG: DUF1800 domain-containing protein [Acidobacteriota bacterium]
MTTLSYAEAAHLLRRAGFGGSREQIESLAARGREGAVDYLVNYEQVNNRKMEKALKRGFKFKVGGSFINNLRRWWVSRMVLTERPLEEKMTFFWHNHFATSGAKVLVYLMYFQNFTLRQKAMGRFDDMLLGMLHDPAMLFWLDGNDNVRGKPNENFARELQELFSMGIRDAVTGEPNYTEDDVKEIARAFTGWSYSFGNLNFKKPEKNQAFFVPERHDAGAKTVYGQTANYRAEDIITILSARRATGRYLARQLFEFFARPLSPSDEDKQIIERLADIYFQNDLQIRPVVREILVSDEFYSERARMALVKNPLEFIVAAMRALGVDYKQTFDPPMQDIALIFRLPLLGLNLFFPPDVSGWKMNLGWINTATMLERYNLANSFATNRRTDFLAGPFVTSDQLRRHVRPSAQETVRNFLFILGPLDVDEETINRLTRYLETDERGNPRPFATDDATINFKIRGLLHQLLSLPEYQMN